MLKMTDTPIESVLPIFANANIDVEFLVPTPTGFGKSIMDATSPIRTLLKKSDVHDFETQPKGPANKVMIPTYFVGGSRLIPTKTSLYRPETKDGDPRIWFYSLKKYCNPCNLLALVCSKKEIYVFNLSKIEILDSIHNNGFVYSVLQNIKRDANSIAEELRNKIKAIHDMGFVKSVTKGDPGVGDTLEHHLGISRNCSPVADYKGIELKSSRKIKDGKKKPTTRVTLFTNVPDRGKTYHEILDLYGKKQIPRNTTVERFQLYDTVKATRANAYDLILEVCEATDELQLFYVKDGAHTFVSAWSFELLKSRLLEKHTETFWVHAKAENREDGEYFLYDKIIHTKKPNSSLLAPLLSTGVISVDLAAHINPDTNKYRDHGILFKIEPDNLNMLFGEEEILL